MSNQIIITANNWERFTKTYSNTLINQFTLAIQVQIVSSTTNTISYQDLVSKFIQFVFQSTCLTVPTNQEKVLLKVKTYGNKQAQQLHYIIFNYCDRTIEWRGEVYQLEPNVLIHFKESEKSKASEVGIYSPAAVMLVIKSQILKLERAHQVDDLIGSLQGSLIIAENEYSTGGIQSQKGNYHDRIRVMLDNRVIALGITLNANELEICKTDILPTNIKIVQAYYGAAISDKNNKKCFYIGDGVNAAFVTRVNDKYLTLNPNNVAKLANRIGSHKFIPAKLENVEASKLVSQLSNGQYACTYGMPMTTIIHDGGWNNGSGAAVCNKPIHYIIDKVLRGAIAVDQLNEDYLNTLSSNRETQLEEVGEELLSYLKFQKGKDLEPGEAIEFKGVEVVRNRNSFPVTIDSIRLKKGYFLNSECRSIRVDVKTFCHRYDYNAKLRGNLKKLMTIHQPNTKVFDIDGKPINYDILLGGECIKGVIPNLELFANAHSEDLVFGLDGKLYRNQKEVKEEEIKDWIAANTKQIVIEQVISSEYFNQYQAEFDKRGDKYSDNGDGSYTLKSVVNGVIGKATYAVELSSVPENFTDSYQGVPGQMMLSTMNSNIKTAIVKHQEAAAKNLDLFDLNSFSAEFNLTYAEDRVEFDEKLNLNGKETIEMVLKKLSQKWVRGVKLSVVVNNYTYSVILPTKLLYHYISFDAAGYPLNEQEMMNNIVSLLKLASTAGTDVMLLKEYLLYAKAYLENWVIDIEENKNSFIRGNRSIKSFGMKIITSAEYGLYKGIPEIWLNPKSPLITANSPIVYQKDKLREGSIVLFYRNPLPFFTPGIIRFSSNLDPLVAGISPIVWSKACLADCDGDAIYLVPMSRFGINDGNIKAATELLNHKLGMDLFNKVLEGITPIEDFVKGKSVLPNQFVSSVSIAEFNDVLGCVNTHYTLRVGQGYSLMHDSICSFVDRFHQGKEISDNEAIAIKQSAFLYYEEFGLGGFKPESEKQFLTLEQQANDLIEDRESFDIDEEYSIEDYLAAAWVRTVIAKAEENNGLWHPDLYDSAIQNGVIRSLSKGHLTWEGQLSKLFMAYKGSPVAPNHPFAIALSAYTQFFNTKYLNLETKKEVKVKSVFGKWS